MIILYGTHRFGLKKTGVRKDFCNACKRECISELYESFDCGHIFYIPILPLGRKRRWICTLCGKEPRGRYQTNKFFRILALILFPIPVIAFLIIGIQALLEHSDGAASSLIAAAVFGIPWLIMLYTTIKPKKEPSDAERRSGITPLSREECFYCHGPLDGDHTHPHCPSCNISIYTPTNRIA